MNSPVKIASRASPLALAQVEEIIQGLKTIGITVTYEILKYETAGDKDKTTPLTGSRDNFFTDTIDEALLNGEADVAIHSAKDLPQNFPEGLEIFALTQSLDDKDAWVGGRSWKDLPPHAKVGTSSLLRQKQILQLRPDINIVEIRGSIGERLQLVKKGQVDGIIAAACALKRLKLEGEIKDIFPWEGQPLQGQLAVVGRKKDLELKNLFTNLDVRRHYGKVTLLGAGPGDPDLMAIKGIKALKQADCVFYDYLVDSNLLKYAPQAEHIYAGKRKDEHSMPQAVLSRLLKEKAFEGKNVVRLKGGDPLVFGRGADEIQYLCSFHIEVEIIPGISSATGIPSSLGIPLTARGIASSVVFLSGWQEDEDKNHPKPIVVPKADTIVFLMGLTKLEIIVESLKNSGWPTQTPIIIIANGTRPQEHIVKGTLSSITELVKKQDLKPPALIIVGKIIEFYKPADKKVLLHCGTHPQIYRHLGKIIHWPMIDINPVSFNKAAQKQFLQAFGSADLIVCTSWYAADYLIKMLLSVKPPVDFKQKTFAVIGPRTQEALKKFDVPAAIVAQEETAQGLLKAITGHMNVKGKRIFLPRSSLPNPFLKNALSDLGAIVTEITIYENTKPARRDLPSLDIDGVIFTSPSTVQNFLTDYDTIPGSWEIMAKGPVTLKILQEKGYHHATSLS